jgi:hypothetical protein
VKQELPIAVGYNKGFAAFMLIAGLFIVGAAFATGRLFPQAVTGGILLAVGLLYLTRPLFIVTPSEVQLKNGLGMTVKTYPFRSLSELKIRDGKLFVGEQKVRASRWFSDGGDWARLEAALSTGRA